MTRRSPALLDHELLVVTGKGGVGKTTVAAALGVAASRRGMRAIVVEVAARDDVTHALGREQERLEREVELQYGVHHTSIEPEEAMREYLVDQLPSRRLAGVLTDSRAFAYLTAATPGLRELLTIGKVWELAQEIRRTPGARPYDLVILDAPATGHGVAVLTAPHTFARTARVGRIAQHAAIIDEFLTDPGRTAVVAVARPEELPVNETLQLRDALAQELGLPVSLAVVNRVVPDRLSAADARELAARADGGAPVAIALAGHRRARSQRAQIARLRRGLNCRVCSLHELQRPALDGAAIRELAGELERVL